jgi:hypothetical protein
MPKGKAVMKKNVVHDSDDDVKIVEGPKVLQVDAASFLADMIKEEVQKAVGRKKANKTVSSFSYR